MGNATCSDSLNGNFDLRFVIEATTGKAAVNVTQTAPGALLSSEQEYPKNRNSFLYQGYIYPPELIYTYKNKKEEQRAMNSEELVDRSLPQLNFCLGGATVTPKLLEDQFARLICLEKRNDTWY